MARLPRLNLPGIPQHVVQRGNNRQVSFFAEQDYAVYLDKLKGYAKKYKVAVHAYVLMTNHVHLLLTPETEKGVSQLMQALGRYYVMYVNKTYQRSGTLWEGRYKSTLVDSDNYFLVVSRYIELNPVRAGMVSHPAEYPWSSYRSNALEVNIELLTAHNCYLALGKTAIERQDTYRALFDQGIDELTLEEIRDATNKAWVLGENRFKQQIEEQAGRRASPLPKGGDRKSKAYKNQPLTLSIDDGFHDIFTVNGYDGWTEEQSVNRSYERFNDDRAVLFINNGDSTFTERGVELGITHTAMGRGLVCHDYDRDGDLDMLIANSGESPSLFRNNSFADGNNFLNIQLKGSRLNPQAVGAQIYITVNGKEQMRELQLGNNYVSQSPVEAHFGLAENQVIEKVRIVWPGLASETSELTNVQANQFLVIYQPE